ncbi:MAG: hypothetical protein C4520_06675 [Candidatus Abyssobacteria bacterium SURF_5]|uniref:YfhO family protein n=1 Tax=Abyssobacteria bacterium (strain SURF_5) TaxID=2093360 RepID=A0A3A4NRP1_ABYX5|nr:MAG: hypothetical protein C4520_06675 [Candidatus Abyssubacteria bacterium SURF_5]
MRKAEHYLPPLVLICVLFLFWLFNYGPLQLTTRSVEDCGLWAHNMYNYYLPEYDYVFRRLASGRFPLWNSFQGCGFPTLAGLQGGALYPPNVLFLLMSAEAAISYSTLFHLCLAAVFLYLFVKRIFPDAHFAGALVAALAFVFNPRMYEFVLFPGNFMTICWLPAGMYFSERIVEKPTLARVGWLALSVSMIFLAGFAQATAYVYEVMAAFLLFRLLQHNWKDKNPRATLKVLAMLLLAGVTAAMLAGPQLLPTYELVGLSARSLGTLTPQMSEVYGPQANAFLPWLKGMVDYSGAFTLVDGRNPIPPWSLFLIVVPLAFLRKQDRGISLFFLLIGLLSFVLSLGTNAPFYRFYWDYFPSGNWFTTPIRLRILFYFSLSLLAGAGLSAAIDSEVAGKLKRLDVLRLCGLLIIISAVFAGAGIFLVKDWFFLVLGLIVIHLALISALIMATRNGRRFERKYLTLLLILVILGESGFWYRNLLPFPMKVKPKEKLYNRAVAAVLSPAGRAHIENGWGMGFYGSPEVPEKFGSLFERPVTTNWEPLSLRHYQEFCNYLTGRNWYYGRFQLAGRPFNEKMFDMLSARYIVFSDGAADWIEGRLRKDPIEPRYRLVKDLGAAKVYENLRALEIAGFAPQWDLINGPADLLSKVEGADFNASSTVFLQERPSGGTEQKLIDVALPGNDPIRSVKLDHENIEIDVEAPQAGIVWVSDCHYPGWQAWVDGTKSDVLRVNHAFKGVFVEAGPHKIRIKFMPASFRWGIGLGIAGLILLVAELLWGRLKQRGRA